MVNVVNFVLFQIGWVVTVYSAAAGQPWIGPLFTLSWLIAHLIVVSKKPFAEFTLLLAAAALGYLADSLLVFADMIVFPATAQLGSPSTVWMIALWINFALTLNYSLAWLDKHPTLTLFFGLLGGPLAYYLGSTLNAIMLVKGVTSLVMIAGLWAIATPVLFKCSRNCMQTPATDKNERRFPWSQT